MLVHLDAGAKDPESGLILGRREGGKPRRDLGGNMGSRSGLRGPGAGTTPPSTLTTLFPRVPQARSSLLSLSLSSRLHSQQSQ